MPSVLPNRTAVLAFVGALISPFIGALAFVLLVGAGAVSIVVVVIAPARWRGPLLEEAADADASEPPK